MNAQIDPNAQLQLAFLGSGNIASAIMRVSPMLSPGPVRPALGSAL